MHGQEKKNQNRKMAGPLTKASARLLPLLGVTILSLAEGANPVCSDAHGLCNICIHDTAGWAWKVRQGRGTYVAPPAPSSSRPSAPRALCSVLCALLQASSRLSPVSVSGVPPVSSTEH